MDNATMTLPWTDTAPYAIDHSNHCMLLDGEPVRLTRKEFEVACLLFDNIGAAQSRAQLLEKLWRHAQQWDTRTIDTHVSRVRRKLDIGPHRGWQISTIYGFGYRLERVRPRAAC
jgi:two-component system response regulator RegX3